jgi:DNA-binding transcriptional MerR regulator
MRIGELARLAGINPRTLRYYESIGLLAPSSRTDAGYRIYTREDADRLAFIRRAQSVGLSLAEIAEVIALRDTGTAPCRHVRALAESKVSEIDARVAELRRLRADLVRLAEAAAEAETACARSSSICVAFEESARPPP